MPVKNYPYQNLFLENLRGEKWKDIPEQEMYFKISSYGRIKRLAYEQEYSDGRVFLRPERIIKPVLMKIYNKFTKDHIYFLRTAITLHKQKYYYSLARLVYHCFIEPIKEKDDSFVIIPKDGNGKNIRLSNLKKATLSEKQQRIFDLNRRDTPSMGDEALQRVIAAAKLTHNKEVTQYSMNGQKIKTYPSIVAAAEKTGISHSHISNRARGNEFSAGGFIWRFGKAPRISLKFIHDKITKRRKRNKEVFGKKVSQYKMNGHRIATFKTINDAAESTDIDRSGIRLVIKGERNSAGGFFWKKGYGPSQIDLSGYEYGETLRSKRRQCPIRQYSKDGKLLRKFDSIKEAAKEVGIAAATLSGALTGGQKTAAGYVWKYL